MIHQPSRSMRATAFVRALLVVVTIALVGACPRPTPGPVTPDAPTQVGAWVDTGRMVVTVARWAIPTARVIVSATTTDPGRTQVVRALDFTLGRVEGFSAALDVYVRSGGETCHVRATAMLLHSAFLDLATSLANEVGLALGNTLEQVFDAVGSIVDLVTPRCLTADAGFASAGDAGNRALRTIANRANRILGRALDNLRPLDAGAR